MSNTTCTVLIIAICINLCVIALTFNSFLSSSSDSGGAPAKSSSSYAPPLSFNKDCYILGYEIDRVVISAYIKSDLVDAIEYVESRNDPCAVGDNGEAIGAYQLHKSYVDDVNKLYNKFTYEDRWDRDKSRQMVFLYIGWYGQYCGGTGMGWLENLARIHNGGPRGWEKKSTKIYWKKVKARMMNKSILEGK